MPELGKRKGGYKVTDFKEVDLEDVNMEGAELAKVRWVFSKKDGAERFAFRIFDLGPEGHSPYHKHDFEHETFTLEGKGELRTEDGDFPLEPGIAAYVPPNKMHGFYNIGDGTFRFICCIPYLEDEKGGEKRKGKK
jgi:quercetin dioxygenase-like cupin family protein